MPRREKGPRLYLDPKRKQWAIRDGSRFIRTGCGERNRADAEKSLAQYIGRKHKPEPSGAPMIADVLAVYGSEVAIHKKTARNISYNISNLLKWWGDKTAADISKKTCREYAATKSAPAASADLKVLKAATKHWHEEYGPLNFIPTFWRPADNPPKDRWLTRTEAAKLVCAARPYQHLRRMVLLGLYTGSRPGVVLALHWDQVDLKNRMLSRLPAGAKPDAKKRAPKVRLGKRILSHLKRWHRLDGGKGHVCRFENRAVADPHTAWRKVVKAAGLRGVTRHTLRHTRATWLMQQGVPIWEAAGFLGMTIKTLEKVYGHHDPGYQESAANAR
jgi:integrase